MQFRTGLVITSHEGSPETLSSKMKAGKPQRQPQMRELELTLDGECRYFAHR
jgi:hypothetical protein